jgi:hypothetical protein
MRIYYYAVLGAIGGLLGWQISNLIGLSFSRLIYLSDAALGGLLGLLIGLAIGCTEGLLTRNPVQLIRAGVIGGGAGLIAGALGLPLGEGVFQAVGAERRADVGCAVRALIAAQGLTGGSQLWKAPWRAMGGLVGARDQ